MYEEFEKKIDLPERGFEHQIFSSFPSMILIFMESEEPEIKSKQASKRDRTLKAAPEKLSILFNKLPKQRGWFATA